MKSRQQSILRPILFTNVRTSATLQWSSLRMFHITKDWWLSLIVQVLIKDEAGRKKLTTQPFTLDGSRMSFRLLPRLALMSNISLVVRNLTTTQYFTLEWLCHFLVWLLLFGYLSSNSWKSSEHRFLFIFKYHSCDDKEFLVYMYC
jgi:hypothetical protein